MGTRRKRKLSVYLDPDDPLWTHLDHFKDMSTEGARLMRVGFRASPVDPEAISAPRVNVTRGKVTFTPLANPAPAGSTVSLTSPKVADDDDPGWDG
jgi:hypothetical protein